LILTSTSSKAGMRNIATGKGPLMSLSDARKR
jgi:hypothetical protein